MQNKDVYYHHPNASGPFTMSRSKMNTFRVVLLTSLFWVLIDTFLIFYLTDCGGSSSRDSHGAGNSLSCEYKLEKVQLQLLQLQKDHSRWVKSLPVPDINDQEHEPTDYDEHLKDKNKRLHDIHAFKNGGGEDHVVDNPEDETSSKTNRGPHMKFLDKIKDWFKEDLSAEPTNPPSWPGENGRGVVIPEKLKTQAANRFKENQFNIVASDIMALNRTVPDQRSEACRNREYPVDLPTTSIIIVYHNEANSTLLRGLVSIVRKSPAKYLKEIILVDDASEGREYLHGPLDEFVKTLPVRVKIIRNEKRLGLMRSRLRGADVATADTMTFLDAHIEATSGWLPPLLYEIKKNRKTIPCPVIDVISDDTFEYLTGSEATYGGFDSRLVFDWIPVPEREILRRNNDPSQPLRETVVSPIIDVISDQDFSYVMGSETTYGGFTDKMTFHWIPMPEREHRKRGGDKSLPARTPTMAGGLFTIDRDYFYEIGTYDEGMDIWGAENLEMSFRVWMCGGTLLIIPCSHVGHVFRKQTPYSFPGGTNKIIFRNNRRLVDVWTDEYVSYFHKVIPDLNTVEAGDISSRLELRKKLNCKNFKWYLNNIYLEAPVPKDFYHVGAISNVGLNFCLDTMGRKTGEDAGATFCHGQGINGQGGNQIFEYSKSHNLVTGMLCLDTVGAPGVVKMNTCNKNLKSQQWDYDNVNQYFRNRHTSSCLSIHDTQNTILVSKNCESGNNHQKWTFKDSILSLND